MTASDGGSVDPQAAAGGAAVRDRETQLEDRANYDELTGHFNRTRLREAVDRAIAEGMRRPGPAAFLALSVDDMAGITERFGRAAADTVLVEVGRRCRHGPKS